MLEQIRESFLSVLYNVKYFVEGGLVLLNVRWFLLFKMRTVLCFSRLRCCVGQQITIYQEATLIMRPLL